MIQNNQQLYSSNAGRSIYFLCTIDTVNFAAIIAKNRMSEFEFTNAYVTARYVALYSQPNLAQPFINFTGITAAISLDVYILMTS